MPARDVVTITIEGDASDYVAAVGTAQAATRALSKELDRQAGRFTRVLERADALQRQLDRLHPTLTSASRRLGTLTGRLDTLNPAITSSTRRLGSFGKRLDEVGAKRVDLSRVLPLDSARIEQTTRALQALCKTLRDKQTLLKTDAPDEPALDPQRLAQIQQQAQAQAQADIDRETQSQARLRHRLGRVDLANEEKFRTQEQIRLEKELAEATRARTEALQAQNQPQERAKLIDEERVALARQLDEARKRPLVEQLRLVQAIRQAEEEALHRTRRRLESQYRLGEIESALDMQAQIRAAERQHQQALTFLDERAAALSTQQQAEAVEAAQQATARERALAQQRDRIQEQVQAEQDLSDQVEQTTRDLEQAEQRRAEEQPAQRTNRLRQMVQRVQETTRARRTAEENAERAAYARRQARRQEQERQEREAEKQRRLDQVFREEKARTEALAEQARVREQQAEATRAQAAHEAAQAKAAQATAQAHTQQQRALEQQAEATQTLTERERERTQALEQQAAGLLEVDKAQRVVAAEQEKRIRDRVQAEGRTTQRPDAEAAPTQQSRRTRQADLTRRRLEQEEQALQSLTRQRTASDQALSESLATQLSGLRDQVAVQAELNQQRDVQKQQEVEAAHRTRDHQRRIVEQARAEKVRQESELAFAQREQELRRQRVTTTLDELNRQSQALQLAEVLAQARDRALINEAVRRTQEARAAEEKRKQLEREAAQERKVQARLEEEARAQAARDAQARAEQEAEQAYQRRLRTRIRKRGRALFVGIAQDRQELLRQASQQYAQQIEHHTQESDRLEQSLLRGVAQGQGASEAADQLRQRLQAVQKQRRQIQRESDRVQEALAAPSPFRRFLRDLRPIPGLLGAMGQRFAAMTDSIQLASTAIFRFLLVVGLIKLALAAVPTALALLGGALVAVGSIAAVRYNRALREAQATTNLFAHELAATYRVTNQFGLSIQETATLAQSLAETLQVARTDPLSEQAEGLRQLNIDLVEFDRRGLGAIDLLTQLETQIQQLDRHRQQPLLESILGDNTQAIGLILSRQIAQARLEAPSIPILDDAGQQQITALERGYKRLTQSLYAELNQFVVRQSDSILTLLQFLQVRIPLISQAIQGALGPSLDTFAQRIEATYLRTTEFVKSLEPTWDRIVLRMRQAAALFTSLGLSGPAVVDLAAALVTLAGTMAIITPLLRFTIAAFGLVRTVAPLLTTLAGAKSGSLFGPVGIGIGAAAGLAGGIAAYRFGSGLIEDFERAFEEAKSTERLQADLIAVQERLTTQRQRLTEVLETGRRTRAFRPQVNQIQTEIALLEEQEQALQDRLAQRQRAEEEIEARAQALVAQEEAKAQAVQDRLAQEEAQREAALAEQRRRAAQEQRRQAEALRARVVEEQGSVSALVQQLQLAEAITQAYQTLIGQATTLDQLNALQKAALGEGRDNIIAAARQGDALIDLNRLIQEYADAGDQAGVSLITGLLHAIEREESAAQQFINRTFTDLAEEAVAQTFGQQFAEQIEAITQDQLRERILRRRFQGGTGDLETILDSLESRLNALAQPAFADQITQVYEAAPAQFRQLLQVQDRLNESTKRWGELTLSTFQAFKSGLADVLLGIQSLEAGLAQFAQQTLRRILNGVIDEFTTNLTQRLIQAAEGQTAQEGINTVLNLLNTAAATQGGGGEGGGGGAFIAQPTAAAGAGKRVAPTGGVVLTQNIQVEGGEVSPQTMEQIRQAARTGVYEAAQDPYGRALLQALTREER